MNSSYLKSKLNYGDIFKVLVFMVQPKKIVEFGILDGYSLIQFINNTTYDCEIEAFDIFEKFNGNGANRNIIYKFNQYKNVKIKEGDFYEKFNSFKNNSIDILHIDIANNGDVYQFTIDNYLDKISRNGIIILEGGSLKRDSIKWMKKYNKPLIQPIIEKLKIRTDIIIEVIDKYPSLTIIMKK